MFRRSITIALLLAATAAFAADQPAQQSSAPPRQQSQPQIDPNADQLLHQMSDYMTNLKSFRVEANVVDEAVTKDGQRIQFLAAQNVSVRRPDKLRTDRVGSVADTVFRYDGKNFSVYGNKSGYYATAPAPADLDSAIEAARSRFGIDAPGADLIVTKPYDELIAGVQKAQYLGVEPINGVNCHHLAFRGPETDFQVWVQDGAQPLPCRYTITSKLDKGQPEFSVSLVNWQPNAQLSDDMFAFTPPPGAKKIQLRSQQASAQEPSGG